MNLCKYKDILGVPGEGVHSFRVFNLAVFDVLGTIALAYVMKIPIWFAFLLGIILHRIFCVRTTIDKLLFP